MKCQMPYITFERNKYKRSYMGRLEMKADYWLAQSRITGGGCTSCART